MGRGRGQKQWASDPDFLCYDGSLKLTNTSLWLDASRPVPFSFLSSALRFQRHNRLITSAMTVSLLGGRLGSSDALASPMGRRFSVGDLVIELVPAGNVLGSAMLILEQKGLRITYCGAFRSDEIWLGDPPQIRKTDILILDCPYDDPRFVFPSRKSALLELRTWIELVERSGDCAVLLSSELGMAQELIQGLGAMGVSVRVTRKIAAINKLIRLSGVPLAPAFELRRPLRPGEVSIIHPGPKAAALISRYAPRPRIALVSGRGLIEAEIDRFGAEVGFALSCNADSKTLLDFVKATDPSFVYLGPSHSEAFESILKRRGVGVTRFVDSTRQSQLDLF